MEENVGEFNFLFAVNCNAHARNKDISWTTSYLLQSRLITVFFGQVHTIRAIPCMYRLSLTITRT
jgi:hypothetical protein